jgi:GNAT superfamily N-acetyltransferase
MQEISFIAYEPTHAEVLEAMVFDMYAHHGLPFSKEKIALTMSRTSTNPEQLQIKLFRVGEDIIGYAILPTFWSNEYGGWVLILDELYVLPAYRSKGISTLFINDLAQSKDYVLLHLEVVKENVQAYQLYKRVGFEVVERYFMHKKTV